MSVVDFSRNRVEDGFFVLNGQGSTPYEWPDDRNQAFRFVGTYRDSGSPMRDALLAMIRGAKRRVFVASFMIGDEPVIAELLAAAKRLRGGVYVITALDARSLRRGLAEYEEQEPVGPEERRKTEAPEERRKNFERLTRNGVYVRGHESCHAKFAVVDDTIALAGSANFVANGFEWTGEANLVVREPSQVQQLTRLFTALWYEGCQWEVPPGETYQVANRQPARPPVSPQCPGCGDVGIVWTNELKESFLLQSIHDVIGRAKRQLTLASYSVTGMSGKPDLLLQPLREALARGVSVRLFVRQQNSNPSQRADLCCLFDMGVQVFGDLRNHAKGVVADGTYGALFSCNFDAAHGLDSGVEVGVRLDGQPALKDLEQYLDHVIRNADASYVRNPTLEELDGKLAARWCKPWPWPREVQIACRPGDASRFVAEAADGPVLYETIGDGLQLFAGQIAFVLRSKGDRIEGSIDSQQPDSGVCQRLESWLSSVRRRDVNRDAPNRGFCPARLVFPSV
jgi:phosphatidylserine/phosphatidylglycerophosphate/cardiolipin synthase-like enzyme